MKKIGETTSPLYQTPELYRYSEEDQIQIPNNIIGIELLTKTIEELKEQLQSKELALEQWKQICQELSSNLIQKQIEFKQLEAVPLNQIKQSPHNKSYSGVRTDPEEDIFIDEEGHSQTKVDSDENHCELKIFSNSSERNGYDNRMREQQFYSTIERNTTRSYYAEPNYSSYTSASGKMKNESNKIESSSFLTNNHSQRKSPQKKEIEQILEESLKQAELVRNKLEFELMKCKWTNEGLEVENQVLKGKVELLSSEIEEKQILNSECNKIITLKQENQRLLLEFEKMSQQVQHLNAIIKYQSSYRMKYDDLQADYQVLTDYIDSLRNECMVPIENQLDNTNFVQENQLKLFILELEQKLKIKEGKHAEEINQLQEKNNVLLFQLEKFKNINIS